MPTLPPSLRALQQASRLTPEQAAVRAANAPAAYTDTGTGYDPIFMSRPENKDRPSSTSSALLSGRTVEGGGSGVATGSPEWHAMMDAAQRADADFANRASRARQLDVNGTLIDPATDSAGYFRLLGDSIDARRHAQYAKEDATMSVTDPGYARRWADNSFNRARSEVADGPGGYARDLSTALFEAPTVIAENLGKTAKVNYGSLNLPDDPDQSGLPAPRRRAPSMAALARQGGL